MVFQRDFQVWVRYILIIHMFFSIQGWYIICIYCTVYEKESESYISTSKPSVISTSSYGTSSTAGPLDSSATSPDEPELPMKSG